MQKYPTLALYPNKLSFKVRSSSLNPQEAQKTRKEPVLPGTGNARTEPNRRLPGRSHLRTGSVQRPWRCPKRHQRTASPHDTKGIQKEETTRSVQTRPVPFLLLPGALRSLPGSRPISAPHRTMSRDARTPPAWWPPPPGSQAWDGGTSGPDPFSEGIFNDVPFLLDAAGVGKKVVLSFYPCLTHRVSTYTHGQLKVSGKVPEWK